MKKKKITQPVTHPEISFLSLCNILGVLLVIFFIWNFLFFTPHTHPQPQHFSVLGDEAIPLHVIPSPQEKQSAGIKKVDAAEKTADFCVNVPVLLYHHIQPLAIATQQGHAQLTVDSGYFDQQMGYLAASGYHTISAEELVTALIKHVPLPPKSIVVTLDDGYDDAYQYAFPIFKKYNLIGNFMIPTGLIEKPGYMTWEQLKEMESNPLVRIYNHTVDHVDVGHATTEVARAEIINAQQALKSILGVDSPVFIYPYGTFSPESIEILRDSGFIGAYSTIAGKVQCTSFIMTLHRDHVGNAPLSSYGL